MPFSISLYVKSKLPVYHGSAMSLELSVKSNSLNIFLFCRFEIFFVNCGN